MYFKFVKVESRRSLSRESGVESRGSGFDHLHPIINAKTRKRERIFFPLTNFRVLRVLRVIFWVGGGRFPIPVFWYYIRYSRRLAIFKRLTYNTIIVH